MTGATGKILVSILISVTAALAWWRASQGLAGWREISVVVSAGAVISWVLCVRALRTQ